MPIRECKKCIQAKPIKEFHSYKSKKSGDTLYRHTCKSCVKIERREYQSKYYKDKYVPKVRPKKYKKVPKKLCCPACAIVITI